MTCKNFTGLRMQCEHTWFQLPALLLSNIKFVKVVRFAGSCGAGHRAALSNDSFNLAASLFAPFREQDFPLVCSADVLIRLLKQPPAASVPVPQSLLTECQSSWTDWQHPLFMPEGMTCAPALYPLLHNAICCPLPRGRPSELLLTPFWNSIGMHFPERIGPLLGLDFVIDRWVYFAC